MHVHRERVPSPDDRVSQPPQTTSVTLSQCDVEAIDLALRVMLAASTPRDEYFLDLTRARAKLAGLDGQHHPRLRIEQDSANRTVSPERVQIESS